MSEIAVRVYSEPKIRKNRDERSYEFPNYNKVFVFDTETTDDEYQNLKFGSFAIYANRKLLKLGIFYNSNFVSEKELNELRKYCGKNPIIRLFTLEDFIKNIFYPTVYKQKVLCIGFNLPFDISRLAFGYGFAMKNMKSGFDIKLSEERKYPPIKIKHNNSNQSFIEFQSTSYDKFSGYFLDLKTLAVALTDDKHITLGKACKRFNKKYKKLEAKRHGKITQDYIEYNIIDTLATAELFSKLKEEFDKYGIKIPLNKVYSQASLGKSLLEQLGVKPFLETNPNFPPELLGKLMTAYYGGRCECKVRKQPVRVSVLDFTSMYPTMFTLCGLWDFLIGEKIEWYDDTENVKRFLKNLTIDDLRNPEIWKQLNVLVEIQPDDDILPVRMHYDEKTYNVGINYLTSKDILFYPLADVATSKLLTGKCSKIVSAIRFVSKGQQKNLTKTNILGLEIDPSRQNLFKVLVEEKEKLKQINDKRYKAVKILANSSSYGIFIEMNREERKSEVKVHGKEIFNDKQRLEKVGKYFNPVISVFITSASRLALGIVEQIIAKHGETHAYCDTDSMFIPPKYEKEIQEFFKLLNPYSNIKSLFKVEERNIWFYGISSKRYVLYRIIKGKFIIKDDNYSLHGLGHILNPFGEKVKNWQKQIWVNILKLFYKQITEEEFLNHYRDLYTISQLTVSSKGLMKRFEKLNEKNKEQIKPFNFFLLGIGNNSEIKPIAPYSKNSQEAVHKEFIDYKSGKVMKGLEYWKFLSDELGIYIEHKESKFDGKNMLKRKHIVANSIRYIGKEANNIEENINGLENIDFTEYRDQNELKKRIMQMTTREARLIGLNPETLRKLKRKSQQGNRLKLHTKTLRLLT